MGNYVYGSFCATVYSAKLDLKGQCKFTNHMCKSQPTFHTKVPDSCLHLQVICLLV